MKKGQTSIRGGVQDALCPLTLIYITQGANVGSHTGTEAIDSTNNKWGDRAPYYAPVDLKVARIVDSHTILWHTLKPVRLARGIVTHMTIMTAHDNTINFKKGFVIKQGIQMGNMGNAGLTSGKEGSKDDGVHIHIEQGYGHQLEVNHNGHYFELNGKQHPIYALKDQIAFEDAYFMDNTKIVYGVADWIYLKDVPVKDNAKPDNKPIKTELDKYSVDDYIEFSVRYKSHHEDPVIEYGSKEKPLKGYVVHIYPKDKYQLAVSNTKGGKQNGATKPVNVFHRSSSAPQVTEKPKPKPSEQLYEGKFKVGQYIEFSTLYQSHHMDSIIKQGRQKAYIVHIYPKDKHPLSLSDTKGGKPIGATNTVNVYSIIK